MLRIAARARLHGLRGQPRHVVAVTRRWRSEPALSHDEPEPSALKAMADIPSIKMIPVAGSIPYVMDIYPPDVKTKLEAVGVNGVTGGIFGRPFEFLPAMWGKYGGKVTKFGMVGFGKGVTGRLVVTKDPNEYMKVLRAEGQFPSGAIETQWMMKEHYKRDGNMPTAEALWGRGEEWQRVRRVIQRDLMVPSVAKGYGDAIGAAVAAASEGAMACSSEDAFGEYVDRCSFDMFSSAFLGRMTNTANPEDPRADPEDRIFAQKAIEALGMMFPLFQRPQEMIANHVLPGPLKMTTDMFEKFSGGMDFCLKRATHLISNFQERMEQGELNDLEKASYMYSTMARDIGDGKKLSVEELAEISSILLLAAVDTTSGYSKWVLTALATYPEVQERAHQEVVAAVGQTGVLTSELVSQRAWLPYVNAVKRESHRMTPTFGTSIIREISEPLALDCYEIPAGECVVFDNFSMQNDPSLVGPDVDEFRPERWLPDAVESRKGTPAEIIDHPLMTGPFSSGARQCPASRVAAIEVTLLCAQLVKDYKISFADKSIKHLRDLEYNQTLTTTPVFPKGGFVFEPRRTFRA